MVQWHCIEKEEVIERLHSSSSQGITEEQARKRREKYGKNRLASPKRKGILYRFLQQFQDFMVLVLLAAAAVSFVTSRLKGDSDYIDSIIILAIVLVNAITGMIQESRAEKAIEALKKLSAPKARVIREGREREIHSEDLVPGDLVLLETGDMVPADIRLVKAESCKAEESALTGESVPALKDDGMVCAQQAALGDRKNMLFSGTSIAQGQALGIVTAVGMYTQMGRVAGMIDRETAPETPLQKKTGPYRKGFGNCRLADLCGYFYFGVNSEN